MPSNLPVAPKAAPYKRYLTSIWHTRWLRAASVALLWHLSVSAVSGDWYTSISSFFWAFFPFGPAGLRATLFWITSLLIFMIPLSTFKIGHRCTPSAWTTIKTAVSSPLIPASIFLWHAVSAFWFCHTFVYFSPSSQELAWVISGGYGSPDRLNERPIYLFAFLQVLALSQAAWYIYYDKSSMSLPVKSSNSDSERAGSETSLTHIMREAPVIARNAALLSSLSVVLTVSSYSLLLRQPLWHVTIVFAKAFANMARSDASPPGSYYIGGIIVKAMLVGCLLSATWQLDNLLFEAFMMMAPIKNSVPLSASSRDPNGTLLNGLTRKSHLIKTFAFWELSIISESFPVRRKEIFADIERTNSAPMSTLMIAAGIDVIDSINRRIATVDLQPTAHAANTVAASSNSDIQRLPRLLPNAIPARNPITLPSNPTALNNGFDRVGSYISHEARVLGTSSTPWSPPLQKGKQLAIEYSSPTVHDLRSRAEAVQHGWLGQYLLTLPVRLIKSAMLGTPTADATLLVHASKSVTNLLLASLDEDTYGKAVTSVPPTIQAMTRAIFSMEQVIRQHTDGLVTQADADDLEEVLMIRTHLKSCLKELLEKFGSFLRDVGLSIRDLNEASKAAEDRQLFEVLRPVVTGRSTHKEGAAAQKEMEEVSRKGRQQDDQHNGAGPREGENTRRRSGEEEYGKQRVDAGRPGRLFSQLDEGSAIDKAWREKRKSGDGRVKAKSGDSIVTNPRTNRRPEMSDNVLGSRDIHTSNSTSGLNRRRAQAT